LLRQKAFWSHQTRDSHTAAASVKERNNPMKLRCVSYRLTALLMHCKRDARSVLNTIIR
jgi:hypothetical protein